MRAKFSLFWAFVFVALVKLKCLTADFTFELGLLFTVIKVDVLMGCLTGRTNHSLRNFGIRVLGLNRFENFVVLGFVFLKNYLVVLLRFFLLSGFSVKGGSGSTQKSR